MLKGGLGDHLLKYYHGAPLKPEKRYMSALPVVQKVSRCKTMEVVKLVAQWHRFYT